MRVPLNFPNYPFRLKKSGDKEYIWSLERRMWLALTPEEWVRQHVVKSLHERYGNAVQIVQEYAVDIFGLSQRVDIVVFDTDMYPLLIVECKAPEVALSDDVLAQAVRYNSVVGAAQIMITNGLDHRIFNAEQ